MRVRRISLPRKACHAIRFVCRYQVASHRRCWRSIACAAPSDSLAFDSATICAWKRTWHAQYALATPLRPYFVPRLPGRCDREVYAAGCDCAGGSLYAESAAPFNCPAPGPGWMYRPEAGSGFEPVQFERLGQIPNDLASWHRAAGRAPQRSRTLERAGLSCDCALRRQIFSDRQIVAPRCEYSTNWPDNVAWVCGERPASVDNMNITGGQNTVCFASG